jgi:hypothetical protein
LESPLDGAGDQAVPIVFVALAQHAAVWHGQEDVPVKAREAVCGPNRKPAVAGKRICPVGFRAAKRYVFPWGEFGASPSPQRVPCRPAIMPAVRPGLLPIFVWKPQPEKLFAGTRD